MSGFLELENISKRFGAVSVLEGFNLSVRQGEFLVLVGPSGCGKSTALRTIAGLEKPTSGDVRIDGKSVVNLEPKDRDIAMVFQSYALYPHMNVFENMAFGLRMSRKFSEVEIQRMVNEAAEMLQLGPMLKRRPKELSGGQRQRVALGRALVRKPKVFLFDEPLSNLDAHLRNQMRVEIRKLQQKLGVTAVYVTHDQVEATTMGDRIAVMQGGRLQQVDTPSNVYSRPANSFVAGFIGTPEMNFFEGTADGGLVQVGHFRLPAPLGLQGKVKLGVRPEDVKIPARNQPVAGWKARVELVENLGAHALVHLRLSDGSSIRSLRPQAQAPTQNQEVSFDWPPSALHCFGPGGEAVVSGQA